ncbi:MAG: DUF447 domain-containing protein [Pseudomonadota bacterium]
MIYEGIVCTSNAAGQAHLTPLGYRMEQNRVILAPFIPSTTLSNLQATGLASLNFTDDVRVFAGCLTNRRDWPLCKAETIKAFRLQACLSHLELEVEETQADELRPRFVCKVSHSAVHQAFRGYNRAQSAVIEACILVSRLDMLPREKIHNEMTYLNIAIEKTAGERELIAWQWLLERIDAHSEHAGLKAALSD